MEKDRNGAMAQLPVLLALLGLCLYILSWILNDVTPSAGKSILLAICSAFLLAITLTALSALRDSGSRWHKRLALTLMLALVPINFTPAPFPPPLELVEEVRNRDGKDDESGGSMRKAVRGTRRGLQTIT